MRSALHCLLLFSALWTLSFCGTSLIYVVNEAMNWTEAQEHCREKYTDLLTIESEKKMDYIAAALAGEMGHFWIGLKQKSEENTTSWIWSDGSYSSYEFWDNGQPDNSVGDNCVQLWSDLLFQWNDVQCCWPGPFICYEGE
ncbi:hepatic lectin-like [Astyanax mexicanus]|uniref:hepatic lectin-like n=1 Tax=Astyanax mexicanus TaxID=7994 RepID=UPI0020CADD8B|nr:hepatic lectin-like [Astyanax mexicanus]